MDAAKVGFKFETVDRRAYKLQRAASLKVSFLHVDAARQLVVVD